MAPTNPKGDLGMVNYVWIANITLDWAGFVRSFVRCCAAHPNPRVRHAGLLDGRDGLCAADTLYDDLRFRYISICQKAKAPYTPMSNMIKLAPNEVAFDRDIYDIFFGGPRASSRPQQIMKRLVPHYDRLSYLAFSSEVPPESLLLSIETVADAVEQVTRRIRRCCARHGIDPTNLSAVKEEEKDDDDGGDEQDD